MTTVLYIGGWGRSGSTLLDRMLGQLPGLASLGEVRELWQRGVMENRPCGCGEPFHDCPFWTEVGTRAFGGWDALDREAVLQLRYSLDRPWSAPVLLAAGARRGGGRLASYRTILGRLYAAIQATSGARVVVDSSKLPTHALILRGVPGVDLRLLHLVRDSRGVVFSWQKRVLNRVTSGEPRYMEKYGPISASVRYDLYNGLTRMVGRMGVPYLRVRYEDLVHEPKRTLALILRHAGEPPGEERFGFVNNGSVSLAPNHTVDGNPMRFSVGPVQLRVDDQWKLAMRPSSRRWVTALTAPLLLDYGYPIGRGPAEEMER